MEATHKMSVVFFPGSQEIEFTWEDLETGKTATLCAKVTMEIGQQLADVIQPCAYVGAVVDNQHTEQEIWHDARQYHEVSVKRVPESFMLWGCRITVEFDESLQHNDDVHGSARYRQHKIILQPSTPQTPITGDALMHNFLHELTHFLLYCAGEDEFDPPLHKREYFVDRLAGLLHQALKSMRYYGQESEE